MMTITITKSDNRVKIFHLARISVVDDWLACGWLPTNSLEDSHHGEWSVLMKWVDCGCRKTPRLVAQK